MSIPPQGVPTGNDDADPTGMRDVLSSLPEPGPMPADLADRICASLEREQGMRGHPPWDTEARVHDVPRERAHRRPQQWILAAAAVVAVGVVGTVVFDEVLNPGSADDNPAAAVPPPQRAQSNAAEEGAQDGSAAGSDDQGAAGDSGASEMSDVDARAQSALQAVEDDVFAVGAQSLLEVASGQSSEDSSRQPLGLPLDLSNVQPLDVDELDNCITATGMRPQERSWVGAPTAINGEDVVIVGSTGPDDPHQAWALDQTCPDNSDAGVLKGPIVLP